MNRTQNYGRLASTTLAQVIASTVRQDAANTFRRLAQRTNSPAVYAQALEFANAEEAGIGAYMDDQFVRVQARMAIRYAKISQRISGRWPARWTESRGGGL